VFAYFSLANPIGGRVKAHAFKGKINFTQGMDTAHGSKDIAHFTYFLHILMSTRKYLLYARMWNIKAKVACLAKRIDCKNTGSQEI